MNLRRLVLYLLLNVLVSASATLAVLWFWDRAHAPAAPPTALSPAVGPTAAFSLTTPGPAPVTPFPSPPPPSPVVHTVQSGETLGAIAEHYNISIDDLLRANNLTNPNVLDVGQVLVIPIGGYSPTATPAPTLLTVAPLPTSTPNPNQPPPRLVIREVQSPGVLDTETVVIANAGGPVDLTGWTLRDEAGRTYIFPALTLFEQGVINVHTAAGQDTVIDLYWGQTQPVWAAGRVVLLADPAGGLIARLTVP